MDTPPGLKELLNTDLQDSLPKEPVVRLDFPDGTQKTSARITAEAYKIRLDAHGGDYHKAAQSLSISVTDLRHTLISESLDTASGSIGEVERHLSELARLANKKI